MNSKWIKGLNVRPETINVLEESIGVKLTNIGLSDVFVDLTPKARETRKNKQMDHIKLKSFCTSKEIIVREFPAGPVVRTRDFYCWDPHSIPGWGTKIPQDTRHSK